MKTEGPLYTMSFQATRELEKSEIALLTKRFTKLLHGEPLGKWQLGMLDAPAFGAANLHKSIDPLLGYDRKWLVNALLDHLSVQRNRVAKSGVNSQSLNDLQFTLSRIDEFAGETVPQLDDLRAIVERGVY